MEVSFLHDLTIQECIEIDGGLVDKDSIAYNLGYALGSCVGVIGVLYGFFK